MSHLSYLDVSLLNTAGWKTGVSGQSWFKDDKQGNSWQVYESDESPLLTFVGPSRESVNLTRDEYDSLFR